MARVPVVYTEHNVLERYHPLTRRANLLTWRHQEAAIAVSADVAESLRRGAPRGVPVKTILNGVDIDRFDPRRVQGATLRESLGISPSAPVVGTVAVFRTQKRLDEWLRVAKALVNDHPGTHFILVGDGPLRHELEALADSLDLDTVHWVGLQEDVRPYLAAMDVYMMSSRFEGLPVALLEAMAMGCAVVSTSVGGIPEVLRHRVNGLLVDGDHPERLAAEAAALIDSPEQRAALGADARRTVEEGYSVARMARQLEQTYVEAVRGYRDGR
jgi:glycosyltransferase involved in cell wall biosynthesis